ncbi:aspartate kinase [Proteinivorax hydrogeniformans]|uniref:Aspartokinase n=1 Tax=Proteinivorax hydrogeniformans TaxID=1826727 RepID=A0AAU8HQ91_9FIRM
MNTIVQKFGGSSLSSIDKMKTIADRVIRNRKNGFKMVVIVSAMGKTTNNLIELSNQACNAPSKRELDMLLATGEQVSASLLTMILKEKGYDSIALTGQQAGVKTTGIYCNTKIADIDVSTVKEYLNKDKIVIIAGFQGVNERGEVTTLGRGGSDTTAVAFAAKLGCKCEIYTDVEGIYSVDPRLYSKAQKLDVISYEEMKEMSQLGAKVMECRSVEIGHRYKVPIYVASSLSDASGTLIKEWDKQVEERSVTGLSVTDDVLMVTLKNIPHSSSNVAEVFTLLAEAGVSVDIISQTLPREGFVNLSFTASAKDYESVKEAMEVIAQKHSSVELEKDDEIIKLSVVGTGMRTQSGVAAKLFRVFADNQIEFQQVTTSEISISYTLDKAFKQKAVDVAATAFNL